MFTSRGLFSKHVEAAEYFRLGNKYRNGDTEAALKLVSQKNSKVEIKEDNWDPGLGGDKNKYKVSGFSDGDYQKRKQSDSSEKNAKDDVPSISFFTLFRFATTTDVLYIIIALVSSAVAACSTPLNTLLLADLLQSMVDFGISVVQENPNGDAFLESLFYFAVYNSIIGILLVIFTYIATVLMNIAAYNQVYKIRQEYLKAALNQDFEYFDIHKTGDIATKINSDILKLEDGIGEKLATFIFYQCSFISSIIMALIKGWKLALLCLISFPVTMTLVGVAGLVASRLSKKEAIASGKAGAIAEEVLSSIRTVYAFTGMQKEIERYEKYLIEARKINIQKGLFNGLAMGFLFFCIFCAYALSFWFGYRLMVDEPENYDVSTMIAVFFGVMTGSANFGVSSTLMEVFGRARGAGAQIFNLIDNVPIINPLRNLGVTPPSIDGNIELKDVVFHYPSRPDVPVLKGVNLRVKRGQSVALVGHSGCGKSTIIQLISRYYDVIDGNVCIDGNDVRQLSVRWLRSQIGLVGQEPALFNMTVRQNIRFGREEATDQDIEAAAKQANAHEFIMKLPNGYDTLVGERGASISGGQKQRIAIARALVRNPPILLLDEATSALDTSSEAKVQKALDKAQEGRTTIVVAHRLSTIRNVDVIYVFKEGSVIETGNHDELMKLKGHYYDMVMLQTFPGSEEDDDNNGDNESRLSRKISNMNINDDDDIIDIKNYGVEEHSDVPTDVSFWRVVRLNSPEWKSVSLASFCAFLSGFAMPLIAVIFGDFIGILSNPDEEKVLAEVQRFALIFVGIGLYSGVANFTMVFLYAIAGEHLTERLRKMMFEKLLQQEVAFYDDKNNTTGALCARLSGEAAAVQGATGQRIGTVLQAIGTFGFALVLSLVYEWRVGLVALTFIPILVFVLYKEVRMAYAESFGTAKTMEASSKTAVEAVANVRTVASLGGETKILQDYIIQLLPALLSAKRASHWRGVVFGLSRSLFNFVIAASLYYGGTLIVYEKIEYEVVFKSAQALLLGASSAAQAFAFAPNFQKGIKAAGRVVSLLNRESKITDPHEPVTKDFCGSGEASIQAVQFKYPNRPAIQVLKNFNLEIEKGKTFALVGSSGCGKSTVIQLLQRFYDPDDGIVAQDGIPLPKLTLANARQSIGFVQQEPVLFDRTIGENIAYGNNAKKVNMDDIIEAAKQANIHNFITSLPLGYETNIGTKGTQLSGGQKQRIAIARALIRRPKMLLLDEATSALDTESEKVVQEALDAAKAGRTCVMIAHRLSTVRDADSICVVSDGRIAEKGKHHELLELKGLYYNLNRRAHS
ncbi:ATP-dependent translocase ABCB1 isoform X2 [Bombyx mori]|uniref:ABC-type xenobiotic transporter n=1 Tax=Bombyx mori TaxID=7091 RepID=A0A8R2HLA9_BOMMO|nr:ATP-dependent translocase ABCB1 isoform X2 [Bombyx mori]